MENRYPMLKFGSVRQLKAGDNRSKINKFIKKQIIFSR